jgi:hypothetical protein
MEIMQKAAEAQERVLQKNLDKEKKMARPRDLVKLSKQLNET